MQALVSYNKNTSNFANTVKSILAMSQTLPIMLIAFVLFIFIAPSHSSSSFTFNGFKSANLTLDGLAQLTPNGLLRLSNVTKQQLGHAFYPNPLTFKNSSNGSVLSFSTYFVFAIVPDYLPLGGHGMAFVIAPTLGLPGSLPSTYLGLFNDTNNGNASNHVLAVELDTLKSSEFRDINDNHVGIDINGLFSATAMPAAYYDSRTGSFKNLTLNSRAPMQLWVEYDGETQLLNVTLAPLLDEKPSVPLMSLWTDLSLVLNQTMYVGFSGAPLLTSNYVLGWSFAINGETPPLDIAHLPKLPRFGPKKESKMLTIGLPLILMFLLFAGISSVAYYIRRKLKFSELIEGWELDYMPHRYRYKDLYIATKGFKDKELLGSGGFGKVYRGVLDNSRTEVAVKRVSHESRQGMKEFVAEIISIGRLRHRHLVPLLGYCRRKRELLLVYEYMPNGSLDKFLHDQPKVTLNWNQRFRVIKGVASGLRYLHEEWEQVVIHRDIKASNILLDADFNARLGDFGLARLYDHGSDPQTTHVIGTLGYLAPEHTRTGKATTCTDVYAFGAFLLEVACGKRPVEPRDASESAVLIEWVLFLWSRGETLRAIDPNLRGDYVEEEAKLVLELGLLCSHSRPEVRPRMQQILLYLAGSATLPDLSSVGVSSTDLGMSYGEGFDDIPSSYTGSMQSTFSGPSSAGNSVLYSGR